MSKRKSISKTDSGDDENSGSDTETLPVDFEWFDPQPHDFHGLKVLLRQLLSPDADLFDLSALADLVITQKYLGSTVKCPDDDDVPAQQCDPYAFLSVLNVSALKHKPEVRALCDYVVRKASGVEGLEELPTLLQGEGDDRQVGLILSERYVNMPIEVVPPMYKMLLEEIEWAVDEEEPYNFSHYLFVSKTYQEVTSALPSDSLEQAQPPISKKQRKGGKSGGGETFYFHPEDEVFGKFAIGSGGFEYSRKGDESQTTEGKPTFLDAGIEPRGHLVLMEAKKFKDAVTTLHDLVAGGTS